MCNYVGYRDSSALSSATRHETMPYDRAAPSALRQTGLLSLEASAEQATKAVMYAALMSDFIAHCKKSLRAAQRRWLQMAPLWSFNSSFLSGFPSAPIKYWTHLNLLEAMVLHWAQSRQKLRLEGVVQNSATPKRQIIFRKLHWRMVYDMYLLQETFSNGQVLYNYFYSWHLESIFWILDAWWGVV